MISEMPEEAIRSLCLVIGCLLAIVVACIILFLKRRQNINVRHHTLVQQGKVWELLMNLSIPDFLDKLLEFMYAYNDGRLTFPRNSLTTAVRVRRERLRKDYIAAGRDVEFLLGQLMRLLTDFADFLKSRIVDARIRRRLIRKNISRIKNVESQVRDYSTKPRDFFTQDCSGQRPFDTVRNFLVNVLKKAGVKISLRVQLNSFIATIKGKWQELRELEANKKQIDSDVEAWKRFAEEHKDLIDEVLDEGDFYYKDWPEV